MVIVLLHTLSPGCREAADGLDQGFLFPYFGAKRKPYAYDSSFFIQILPTFRRKVWNSPYLTG